MKFLSYNVKRDIELSVIIASGKMTRKVVGINKFNFSDATSFLGLTLDVILIERLALISEMRVV